MRVKVYYIFFILLLLVSFNSYAFSLVGTWQLISIEKSKNGMTWDADSDCNLPTGLIIYTKDDYMSAGINCMKKNSKVPSFKLKDTTFYMGRYFLQENKVIHHVENANDASYYGKDLERQLKILGNNEIYLIIKGKNGSLTRLRWKRKELL